MAENRQETFDQMKTSDTATIHCNEIARSETSEEREQRLKMLRDKQNEERQRKLEELKAQALAAQHFREMKEQERRKRIDELRVKDNDRRQQVGERKRQIYEAERDRRESILKKNQEREMRFEMKKKSERGSIAFAFGSSTPRMLEPADTGGSFWGYRRATSTSNILFSAMPLTRRSSERELDGSKKRATSAGGLDRNNSEGPEEIIPAGCASGHMGRRRTDLMPTIPLRESSSANSKRPFTKSPGRTYSMSRLDQLAKPRKPRAPNELPSVLEHLPKSSTRYVPKTNLQSNSSNKSLSRSMSHLTVTKMLSKSDSRSMHQLVIAAAPVPRSTRAVQLRKRSADTTEGPSRPGSSLSQQSTGSVSSSVNVRTRPIAAPRKPRPASIAVTGITHDNNKNIEVAKKNDFTKPPLPKSRKPSLEKLTGDKAEKPRATKITKKEASKPGSLQSPSTEVAPPVVTKQLENVKPPSEDHSDDVVFVSESILVPDSEPKVDVEDVVFQNEIKPQTEEEEAIEPPSEEKKENKETCDEKAQILEEVTDAPKIIQEIIEKPKITEKSEPVNMSKPKEISDTPKSKPAEQLTPQLVKKMPETPKKSDLTSSQHGSLEGDNLNASESVDMTASMIAKIRITTEEEAKAALAERRRLAREEAERQALAEKLRIQQEEERQRQEEEQLRLLAEEQRKAEEERLAQAIREAQKREEEERQRRQEELRQKLEKEEQEKKAQEEKEKKKLEMEKRLEKEESDRELRRKRVEAIMSRTRAKNANSSHTKTDFEKNESQDTILNGTVKINNQWPIISQENGDSHKESSKECSNGHKNGADNSDNLRKDNNQSLIEHNVTNTLLALNEFDSFRNTNTSLDLSTTKITMEDNVNSNNPTDSDGTRDLLL